MHVVICGAGIVGLVMANLLAQHEHLQLTVLDPHLPSLTWDPTHYDLRCSAIAPSTQKIFQTLNVWQEILTYKVGVYQNMLVWDQELHNNISFCAQDINLPHLGHIIENRVLSKVLYNNLSKFNNVQILQQATEHLQVNDTAVQLRISDQNMECKLLIAADGAKSWIREKLDIPQYAWDYQQHALVATVQTEHAHANTALQRFTEDGTLAFLPLAEQDLCSIVWSAPLAKIAHLKQMPDHDFNTALAQEFAYKLGQVSVRGTRASFPLRLQHATEYVRPRIALLGDAAHVVHPLAGQGLNLGIADAVGLHSVLLTAIRQGADVGVLKLLRKYERQRRAQNTSMLLGIDGLQRLFAKQTKSLRLLRKAGLMLCNQSNLTKNLIMQFACFSS